MGRTPPNEHDRLAARLARRRRLRRQRIAVGFALLALVGGGVTAWVLLTGGRVKRPPRTVAAPPPPPRVRYGGSKLAPQPPKVRRGALPSQAQQRHAVQRLIELGRPVLCGGRRGKYIALTFDDGPGPYTELAMHMLRKRHLRATFFLVGSRAQLYQSLPRREATLGAIGDHTWTHRSLPGLSHRTVVQEIGVTRDYLRGLSHAPLLLFRPPYGAHNPWIDRTVSSLGLLEVLWSVDSGDALPGATARSVARTVIEHLRPGAIVLMHDIHPAAVAALPRILRAIRRRHLRAVTIPELVALDPPAHAQLFPVRPSGRC
jgi:peptidoglycan/xylan/chitin deacetylase (PgdA/CDA1 family)